MEEIDRIQEILKELTQVEEREINTPKFITVSLGNFDPPSYIVEIIFLNVLGFPNYGPEEKVRWHTFFRFNNNVYMIRDYKFDTWSLECTRDTETLEKDIGFIKWRIKKAARYLDKILKNQVLSLLLGRAHESNGRIEKIRGESKA